MKVQVYRSTKAIDRCKEEWDNLLIEDSESSPFQSYGWCYAAWIVYGRNLSISSMLKRLRVIALRDEDDNLVALLSGYIVFKGHLIFQPLGIGISDYCMPLISDTTNVDAVKLLIEKARSFGLGRLYIPNVPSGHSSLIAISNPLRDSSVSPVKSLPQDPDEIINSVSTKFASNLRYSEKQCRDFEFRLVLPESTAYTQHLDELASLHQQRWSTKNQKGVIDAQTSRFFRIFTANDQHQMSRLFLVIDKGKTIGANLSFRLRDRYYYYQSGLDPRYSKYSLGSLLILHQMRNAVKERCTTFDFLRGQEEYKARWKPDTTIEHYLIR